MIRRAGIFRAIRCVAAVLGLAGGAHASPLVATPSSQDLIVGRSDPGAPLGNGYHADPSQAIGAGITGGSGARYNRNAVIGFLLPTLSPGQTIDTASFRITISSSNDAGGAKPVALYGLSTATPNPSGTLLFATDTVAGKVANAGNALISASFSSTGSSSGTPQADVSEFIRSFYTGHVPHQPEVFFRICPTQDTWSTTNRLDFTKGSARLEITTIPGAPVLWRQTGSDPTFQQLIDNGVIVPGVSAGAGPVPGSLFRVNQTLLAQQAGSLGTIPSDIRIHTQVNSSVLRPNFPNFTRWYQEVGNVQVMRLFEGEQNIRSGVGPTGTPGRIEAFFVPFAVPANKWSVWEGTYTIIDPLQSNIFQLFHEGGQLWAFHLRMTNTGTIYFARRRSIAGLPDRIDIATNMTGQSISFMVRSNGTQYELYQRPPVPQQNWQLVTTGSYTPAVDREISYRWGMYYGSQAGQSIPNDGLLFMSGVSRYTVDAPGGDPPPPPPPVPMNYYWDNNGATAGFGNASGVWGETTSGGTQGWSTDATGASVPEEVSTNSVDTLFFGTNTSGRGLGTGTITVSDTVDCADITFGSQSGNITLDGGEIHMSGSRTITLGGGTQTIRSALSGTGSRTIVGTGALSLTGESTFPGPLTVGNNSGGLRLSINSIANADGTPSAAGAPASTANGIIQLGQTSNGSTLELIGSTSAHSTDRRIRIGSNGTGSGGATVQNNNSDPAHTLAFTNPAFNVAATDTSSFNRTLTLRGSNTGDNLIQGAIINNIGGSGGKVALTKSDNGTWVLAGTNTYTGNTTINGGTLRIGNGGTSGSLSTSSSISNHGILEFRRSNTLTQGTHFTAAAISGSGDVVQSGTGTTILNANNTYQGLTTIDSGTLRIQHAGALGSTAAGTVVNGVPSGSPGNARLELAGGITVAGEPVTISGGGHYLGALNSQSGSNEWAGTVTLAQPGARIGANDGATLRVSGPIDSGGQPHGLVVRAGLPENGAVILSGENTYLGDTTLYAGKLQLDGGDSRLPAGTRLILGNGNAVGELDLNGTNQQLAGLAIASDATAANNSVNNSSTTPSTLTLHAAAGSPSAFPGILNGNLALTKSGEAAVTLSGTNTFSGDITVSQGVLQIGDGGTSGTLGANSDTLIAAGAELRIERSIESFGYSYFGELSGNGTVTIPAGRRFNFRADQPGSGGLAFAIDGILGINTSDGVTLVELGELSGSGIIQRAGNTPPSPPPTLLKIGGRNTSSTYSGNIANVPEFALEKTGSGTLTLEGTSDHGGSTTVSAGTLALGAAAGLPNSSSFAIAAGAALDTAAKAAFAIPAARPFTFRIDPAGAGTSGTLAARDLDISSAVVTLDLAGTPDDPVYVLATYTSLTGTAFATEPTVPAGYQLQYDYQGDKIALVKAAAGTRYDDWATLNGAGSDPHDDHDGDGVPNGIELFLNAIPGFTPLPVPDATGTVAWTNGGNLPASEYGRQFVVQTSADLLDWSDVPTDELAENSGDPGIPGRLAYTLDGPPPRFVRIKVTPD